MRRAFLLAPVLSTALLVSACSGDDKAQPIGNVEDSGGLADTSTSPTDSASADSASDSTVTDSSVPDAGGDTSKPDGAVTDSAVVDSAVADSGTPDVPLGTDALYIPDTYIDAIGITDGTIPDVLPDPP